MTAPSPRFEQTAAGLLLASVTLVTFNLSTAQVLFGIAALMWVRIVAADATRQALPSFFWPLAAFAGWTIISAFFSIDPARSIVDLKQLVLFLIVPMVMRLARGDRAMTAINVTIAVGAVAALVGVVQGSMFGYDNLENRPPGLLTHYMTYSGVIMLVLCAAVARLLFYPDVRTWPGVAIPALAVALAMTFTRNAYLGAAVGVMCLLAARNMKLLLLVPVAALVLAVAAPQSLRARVGSMVNLEDDSNRDRVQMLQMGAEIVRDHPWFGVGPEMIGRVYGQYLRPNPVHTYNPHLHNVPMQIAAERGLPALALWFVFIGTAAAGLLPQVRNGPARAIAGAGLASIAAMLSAGMFEYNFGDSEFLMLFLSLITLPYAARLPASPATRPSPPSDRPTA